MIELIINLVVLCVVLGIVYIIAQAILGYLAVPWSGLALKVIGLLCLLVVAIYLLRLLGSVPPLHLR